MKPIINFIGCGKLGKTIAKLIKTQQLGTISAIKNSSYASAEDAVQFIGEGKPVTTIKELPSADLYFIATTDDQIQSCAEALAREHNFNEGSIVAHLSGALSSEVLAAVKKQSCFTASIHPIKSFTDPRQSHNNLVDTFCAVEGDEEAVTFLTFLFEKMGGIVFQINKDQKALYHAACVIANNYLTTLHHSAFQCFRNAGVDENIAKAITSALIQNSLNNLNRFTHQAALTGPLQRGDAQTIAANLQALEHSSFKQLYASLGIATLDLVDHSEQIKTALLKILQQ